MALQIWLPLNGNLNNQGLADITITNNSATVNSNGKLGQCYQFGTAASDIALSANAMTSFSTEASISFWINILSWNTSYATFFQAGIASTAWTAYVFGFLRNNANSTCCFTISNGSSASNANYLTPVLDLNVWYHITLCYKTGHCLIYINGTLYQDYTTSIVPNFAGITTIKLGRCTNGSSYQTNCLVNDFRIYDHCLSDKEIAEIAKGLVLHYPLNNNGLGKPNLFKGGYQVTTTSSGNNETGTLQLDTIRMPLSSLPGKTFTFTYDYSVEGAKLNNTGTWSKDRYGIHLSYTYTKNGTTGNAYPGAGYLEVSGTGRAVQTFTIPSDITVDSFGFGIQPFNKPASGNNAIWYLKNVKLEEGSIDNGYTPYIEDFNTIYDFSGYHNNGEVLNGPLTIESPSPHYNSATHISATNQKIKISNLFTTGFSNSYSFAWWEKISSVSPMHWGFANGIRLNGMYTGRLWNTGDGSNNPLYNPGTTTQVTAPTLNVWHHWVMTGDGTICKVYQDGELWGEAKTYKAISGSTIYINGWDTSTSYCSDNASMSDFRIYATALSAADVLELYRTSQIISGTTKVPRDLE